MKPNPTRLSAACLFLCLAGCGHGHEDHARHEPGHGRQAAEPELRLDDGKKWQVDEHTRASAARIKEMVGESGALDSLEAARALGERLDGELDVLVKGCTMTGAAHDQLHVWLVALVPRVEALKVETDVADLRSVRAEIDSLLAAYEAHFE